MLTSPEQSFFFATFSQSAHLFLSTRVSPHSPKDGTARIFFSLTPETGNRTLSQETVPTEILRPERCFEGLKTVVLRL